MNNSYLYDCVLFQNKIDRKLNERREILDLNEDHLEQIANRKLFK